MKKFVLFSICLLVLFSLLGCNNSNLEHINSFNSQNNQSLVNSSTIHNSSSSSLVSSVNNFVSSVIESVSKSEANSKPINKPIIKPEINSKTYLLSTADNLRVRSSNSVNSSVLGYLDKGDLCVLVSKVGEFYKTIYKEKVAYVSVNYCKEIEFNLSSVEVEKTIDFATKLIGYPYVWGSERYHWGNGILNKNFVNGKFDCSALVQYVYFKTNNVLLDVTSRGQSLNGKAVSKNNLRRGDLIFFTNKDRFNKQGIERIGHVGIYFGDNYILHTASDHAVIEPISDLRWSYYITARRVI